ncbi:MAG: AbrB/MazE/SpoVT family DNA-binding domain-containing protein [Anaerolineales bacterium]|nr:AbrB/MazE/SpoVT family DNA-binding domain-containing protein [Anaerolineales bacterium]
MGNKAIEQRARLREKGQVTLPKEVRAAFDLHEGDDLVFRVNENGELVVERVVTVPADQAWFWTERWQKMEREAQADIDAGRVTRYEDEDSAIEALEDL